MIDLQQLRRDPDGVRDSQRARGADVAPVDRLLAADEERRAVVARADDLRAESNAASRGIGAAGKDERPALIATAQRLKAQVREAEAAQAAADEELRVAHLALPNVVQGAPPGGEADFVVLREPASLPSYDFEVRDHLDLGQRLRALDTERGAKVSGSRFAFLTGVGALLEMALVRVATGQAVAAGCTPVVPPVLVKPESMEGTGFLGEHADEIYRLERDDLYLVGTSEVPLAALHSGEVLDEVPLRYAAFSSCFRREAGSYGKDVRGIIRVHQFDKVEMFSFVDPANADDEHQRLLAQEEQLLQALQLPYRVIDVAAGDLGTSAARKYDCEVWLPSQQRFLELTSASNCTTFQGRRLGTRRRTPAGPEPVATLNGTLCAVQRTLVALLEVHQQADGSVHVPEVLRPHLAPLLPGGGDAAVLRPPA